MYVESKHGQTPPQMRLFQIPFLISLSNISTVNNTLLQSNNNARNSHRDPRKASQLMISHHSSSRTRRGRAGTRRRPARSPRPRRTRARSGEARVVRVAGRGHDHRGRAAAVAVVRGGRVDEGAVDGIGGRAGGGGGRGCVGCFGVRVLVGDVESLGSEWICEV